MSRGWFAWAVMSVAFPIGTVRADAPVASYIFPAGGQRGTTVPIRVGGLFLHQRCSFEMLGPGVIASPELKRTQTTWFEGPFVPLPESQQAEDYPQDMAGSVRIAANTPLGVRHWRLATAQGATPALKFVVGDLPEVLEEEIDGEPIPIAVPLPVTINGRIFPREDVDVWEFQARRGQTISCGIEAARIGSPLDARLEVLNPQGQPLAENDDSFGADPFLRFTAPADGRYQVRVTDINFGGGQAYVYRLTLTAGPVVDRVFPLGGRRGSATRFEMTGQGLLASPVNTTLPATAPRNYLHRLTVGSAMTNPFLLELDDLPEHLEIEPNDAPCLTRPLSVPAILNGRIGQAADVDHWAIAARKDERWELDLHAGRLGSPLHALLSILDSKGKELARSAAGDGEPRLHFTAPAAGVYLLRVQEQFRSRGGPGYAYRLHICSPAPPDFALRFASDAVTVPRGGEATLRLVVDRVGGFAGSINVQVEGLPPDVSATGTSIATNQSAADIKFKANGTARIGTNRLTIRGVGHINGQPVARTAALNNARGEPELDSLLLAVALPTPFKIVATYDMRWAPRGTVYHRRYRIERNGFTGPLEIKLADRQARHLQGVTGPTLVVPPAADTFDYAVSLPPWMETGRTCRVCVMGLGQIKEPDGRSHTVSFSSVAANEQVVVVIEPERLGLEVNPASLRVTPGEEVAVAVRVLRGKGIKGPIKLELILAPHQRGLSAGSRTIGAKQSETTLPIHFASGVCGPLNVPLLVRATAMDNGEPVIAEARLKVLHCP